VADRAGKVAEKQTDKSRARAVEPSSFATPVPAGGRPTGEELHVCPSCAADLVYPIDWEPAEARRWSVQLRCPNCEWLGGGIYSQAVVDRFDDALDRGTEQLLDDLSLLTRANMEDQVERFVAALRTNQVLPEDF
jgi:hypothetical protein